MLHRRALAAAALALPVACGAAPRADLDPHRVIAVEPGGIPITCGSRPDGVTDAISKSLPGALRGWACVPSVIRTDGVDQFVLEVWAEADASRVYLDGVGNQLLGPGPGQSLDALDLVDDGSGADRVAGDGTWTAGPFRHDTSGPRPPARWRFDPDSPAGVETAALGQLHVVDARGDDAAFLISPEVGLLAPEVPERAVLELGPDVQVSEHFINVRGTHHDAQAALRLAGGDVARVTRRLYDALPDDIHHLVFFSTEHLEWPSSSSNFNAGIHVSTKVDWTGTGQFPIDGNAAHGSGGTLLGWNVLDAFKRGMVSNNAVHEIAHQWAASLNLVGMVEGVHWSSRMNSGSLLGGFLWTDAGDGDYAMLCDQGRNGAHRAAPIDLYVMGLLAGADLPTIRSYDPAASPPGTRCFLEDGHVPAEEVLHEYTAADLERAFGPRVPGPEAARRDFVVGFVAESHERLLTPTEMTWFDVFAEHFARELPPEEPDPYLGFNWVPVTRFFGDDVRWSTRVVLPERCREPSAVDARDVEPLAVARRADGSLTVSWEWSGVEAVSLYRGTLTALWAGDHDHAAMGACEVDGATVTVPDEPGDAWFVAATSCAGGDSSSGRDSRGGERPEPVTGCR